MFANHLSGLRTPLPVIGSKPFSDCDQHARPDWTPLQPLFALLAKNRPFRIGIEFRGAEPSPWRFELVGHLSVSFALFASKSSTATGRVRWKAEGKQSVQSGSAIVQ